MAQITIEDIKQAISYAINTEIKPLVDDSIKSAINTEIKPLIDESIKSAIANQLKPAIADQIKHIVDSSIKQAIEDQIKPLIDSSIKTAIEDQIKPLVDDSIKKAIADQIMPILNSIEVKERNSRAGPDDSLIWPPHKETGVAFALDQQESISISCLLVAGNETLPNGQRNRWNKAKSKLALNYYGEDGGSDSDDDEYSAKSRARRLRLAGVLGISRAQLNFAQLAL